MTADTADNADDDGYINVSVDIEPVGPARTRYGGRWVEFYGRLQKWPGGDTETRLFRLLYPVTDRRVARRISRDTGRKFRMVNGIAEFRD